MDKTGADAMAGDGGYSLGTLEELDKFAKSRNQSRVLALAKQAGLYDEKTPEEVPEFTACFENFAELIMEDMHKKVIASILITDVVMEAKGQTPTTEDYISAINKDFGVE